MHPVEPSTIVRGPDALTMSFMTSADSHPWQVRCPDVKYSSIVTRLTPRKGSRICVALLNVVVSAIEIGRASCRERVYLAVVAAHAINTGTYNSSRRQVVAPGPRHPAPPPRTAYTRP